jgi:hypothetical protein
MLHQLPVQRSAAGSWRVCAANQRSQCELLWYLMPWSHPHLKQHTYKQTHQQTSMRHISRHSVPATRPLTRQPQPRHPTSATTWLHGACQPLIIESCAPPTQAPAAAPHHMWNPCWPEGTGGPAEAKAKANACQLLNAAERQPLVLQHRVHCASATDTRKGNRAHNL